MINSESACRLYVVVPAAPGPDAAKKLAAALDAGSVGCVLLRAGPDGAVDRVLARTLLPLVDEHDAAFLLEADTAAAAAIPTDGVHVAGEGALYSQARAALGAEAIIGVECPPERDRALTLAEQGADYVAFTAGTRAGLDGLAARAEIVRWWAEIVEVPVVAWAVESPEEARRLARDGADFVAVEAALWRAPGAAADAVRAFDQALAEEPTTI